MNKAYERINWENYPSENTALDEINLNKMDKAIDEVDNRVVAHETTKLDVATANSMVKDVDFDETTGIFTITFLNGVTKTLDTKLEKIATNFRYDYATQKLILTLVDGTTQEIDMSALLTQYEFENSAYISFTVVNGKVKAEIINGSITADKLQPNFLADVTLQANSAKTSEQNAKTSEENAKQSEINAKNYADSAEPVASTANGLNPTLDNSTGAPIISFNGDGEITQDGTPSPDNEVPIYGVGESRNEFNTETLTNGYALNTSGNPYEAVGYSYSDYNELEKGQSYYISNCEWYNLYDENKTVVGNSTKLTPFVVPDNVKYIRVSIKTENKDIVQLEKGTKATPYKAFGAHSLSVKTTGKCIFGGLPFAQALVDSGSVGVVLDESAKTVTIQTKSVPYSVFDNFKENTQYTFIIDGTNTASAGYSNLLVKYTDGTHKVLYTTDKLYVSEVDKTIERLEYNNVGGTQTLNYEKCGIFEGVITADEFEPYTETTADIPLSSPLYEGDYIRYNMDGSGELVRKMASIVLDCSSDENWFHINPNNYVAVLFSPLPKYESVNLYSDCYVHAEKFNVSSITENEMQTTANGSLIIGEKRFSTMEEWKAWLAENPVTVVYELAEPTVTPLTAEQIAEFEKLRSFDGTTHITCEAECELQYFYDSVSGKAVASVVSKVENELRKSEMDMADTAIHANRALNTANSANEKATYNGSYIISYDYDTGMVMDKSTENGAVASALASMQSAIRQIAAGVSENKAKIDALSS